MTSALGSAVSGCHPFLPSLWVLHRGVVTTCSETVTMRSQGPLLRHHRAGSNQGLQTQRVILLASISCPRRTGPRIGFTLGARIRPGPVSQAKARIHTVNSSNVAKLPYGGSRRTLVPCQVLGSHEAGAQELGFRGWWEE